MEKAFDKADLSHLDVSMRAMVERSYDLCLYNCMETKNDQFSCKQGCFNKIIVPFRHANHVARDSEEANYRTCLAKKENFPALQQEDFISCSNNLF